MAKGQQKANFSSLAEMFSRKGQHKKTMSKDLTNRFTQENAHDAIELHSHTHEKHTHTQAHTHRDTQTQTHRHAHSHTHKHTSTHTQNTHTHTQAHSHTHKHTSTHTQNTSTHTHTHTHTHRQTHKKHKQGSIWTLYIKKGHVNPRNALSVRWLVRRFFYPHLTQTHTNLICERAR